MKEAPRILYCHCAYAQVVPAGVKDKVFQGLCDSGAEFTAVADMCELCARQDESLKSLLAGGPVRIAACFNRAVKWLLHSAGVQTDGADIQVFNMRKQSAEEVLSGVLDGQIASDAKPTGKPAPAVPTATSKWIPWFPVIDFSRCVNCKQCHGFCLFGVYEVRDGKVRVANPDKCKTNCPACARICPSAAIMFPKFADSPINGDEVREEDLKKQKMQTDVKSITSGDVYAKLRSRAESQIVPDRNDKE